MDEVEVTILKWEEHQPKTDAVRHPHWFKVRNSMPSSESLYGTEYVTRWVWLSLLCLASQRKSSRLTFNCQWFAHWANIRNAKDVKEAILELQTRGIIESAQLNVHPTDTSVRSQLALDKIDRLIDRSNMSKSSNLRSAAPSASPPVFNFLEIYAMYPKHEGKTDGIKKCERIITTKEQYDKLKIAVQNYALAKKGVEKRFLKLFSTFMSTWQDWLDPAHGNEAGVVKKERKVVGKLADGTPVYG